MSAAPRARALLLDLDGTLLDTAPDMAGALNALRLEEGRAPLPLATLRPFVSHGAIALVRAGFGDVDEAGREHLRVRFLDLYRAALSGGTRLFEGFEALLARLDEGAMPWGVVTNKPGWLTAPLLADLGLAARVACVVSGDTLAVRKPDPAPLVHAAAQLGLPPGACVYAGDAERDIIAGRAAGMRTIAVRWGYLAPGEDPGRGGRTCSPTRPPTLPANSRSPMAEAPPPARPATTALAERLALAFGAGDRGPRWLR